MSRISDRQACLFQEAGAFDAPASNLLIAMLSLILRFSVRARTRSALLGLGLLALSAGILLLATASETTAVVVDADLTHYWRTTYDILVRPVDAHSPIEDQYGLVEANHLSGIPGGITFSQYEAIKDIPGIEVAAPIAMIGYVAQAIPVADLAPLSDVGTAYRQVDTLTIDDGTRVYSDSMALYYYVVGDVAEAASGFGPNYPLLIETDSLHPPQWAASMFDMPFLMAGIDPSQEAALVGLDRAIIEGRYLASDEPLNPRHDLDACWNLPTMYDLPVLINATPYVHLKVESELQRLALPPEISDLGTLVEQGGTGFLASRPGKRIATQEINGATAYDRLVQSLLFFGGAAPPTDFMPASTIHSFASSAPGPVTYRDVLPPFPHDGLALEIVPPQRGATQFALLGGRWRPYRSSTTVDFLNCFEIGAVGAFDIERLPRPADVNRVPLETYFPPLATLRYDEQSRPVVPPRTLYPTLNPAGYIQPPPLVLTTLEAVRAIRGDNVIGAIRVRVGGIGELTPAAQRKIETVASEISRRTGLAVDIMVGSSPRRVLVHVPEIGYVEEEWIQKGINISYQRRVQSGHLLLIAVLLGVGGVYTLDMAWAEVVAQRRTLALQKAVGWRSWSVFALVLGRAAFISLVASLAGALAARGLASILDWSRPSLPMLVGMPLLITGLCLAGALYPAWLAARLPPILALRRGGLRYERLNPHRLAGVVGLARRGLERNLSRTTLNSLAASLSSALLVLLLAVTFERQRCLAGTLLGEYILIHIEGFHYTLMALGFALTTLGTADSLLGSILERRREIGTLQATGWRRGSLARLFVTEGALVGLIGGLVGTVAGLGMFVAIYRTFAPGLAWIAAVGITAPVIVGSLAALYPALVAARTPPAEAMRYE